VRPFEDPAPPGIHDFDLMTFFYAYHDITYLGVDRAKMNKAFYDALKAGGELVVGDYSAKPGAGTGVVQSLHRSDEALVRSEIEGGGVQIDRSRRFPPRSRRCPRRPLAFLGSTGRYLHAEISQAGLTRERRRLVFQNGRSLRAADSSRSAARRGITGFDPNIVLATCLPDCRTTCAALR